MIPVISKERKEKEKRKGNKRKEKRENVGLGRTEEKQVLVQINAEIWRHNGEESVAQKNSYAAQERSCKQVLWLTLQPPHHTRD